MMHIPAADRITRALSRAHPGGDTVTLSYAAGFLRRRVLTTVSGLEFLVDLEHTTSLGAGDAFALDDRRRDAGIAVADAFFEVRGDLARLVWHIRNSRTPCRIDTGRLRIQRDRVMRDRLETLGAEVADGVARQPRRRR